jgi:diacylglycerol kinase family enzyme
MRVTLLHNKSAGSENHAAEDLHESIRRAGHDVLDTLTGHETALESIRAFRPELIAIAGGDGTVSRAACTLAGCGIPLAILPLGTANNTACTLGVEGPVDDIVQRWSAGRRLSFDLVSVRTGEFNALFSEAVGWGVFPSVIANAARMTLPDETERTLRRDRSTFRSVIEATEPRSYSIDVDGSAVTGQFLLVEVMNIPLIGPQLAASPDSDPSDGLLEVVLAGESDRATLLELACTGRIPPGARLRTLRGRHVTVQTDDTAFHRDGSFVERSADGVGFAFDVLPASVSYVV